MEGIKLFDFAAGEVLLINKPYEWTSFDVVKKLRGAIKIKKIGHAGTLDPLATGLLVVCTGKATKKINEFQTLGKEYIGTLEIGKTTPSVDLETEFDSEQPFDHIEKEALYKAAEELTGDLMQVPPIYSAIKIDGQRAYKFARRKEDIKLEPRPVTVSRFDLTGINKPTIDFDIACSKGTYIRSLVRDLGEKLGCGAHMSSLIRTSIGPYLLSNAYELDELVAQIRKQSENLNQSNDHN